MSPQLEIHSELVDGTAKMSVTGELDIATVHRLGDEANALLARSTRHLVIDLGQLTFIDSSGLSLLISLNERAARDAWKLSLTRPPEKISSVVRITGADSNLPFVDQQDSP
jgi:anti-sigma B factor antagonist